MLVCRYIRARSNIKDVLFFTLLYECWARDEFLSSEDAKTKIEKEKKNYTAVREKPFQSITFTTSRKNEAKKTSVGSTRPSTLDKKRNRTDIDAR